ncbi:MAG: GNAT family N-acetyltransferase [Muribaculaceae bacterium]|nr:GNAT family N-acetyltransferase [Muribaculaceae bacterium]
MNNELRLRALEPDDAEMMYSAESDEAAWRYSDYLAPMSREMLRHYALTYDADPMRSGQLRLIIEIDGKAAGILDLFEISPRHLRADTGIYLLPEFRGNGYGAMTLELAKDFCRRRLGLHQLTASVAHRNSDALRCYGKAGFTSTGRRPDWLRTPEGFEDVELLACRLTTDN